MPFFITSLTRRVSKLHIDWILVVSASLLVLFGLVTMNSFTDDNSYFDRQVIWFFIALGAFFSASFFDWSFLRRTNVLITLFALLTALLGSLLILASSVKGAKSWIDFGLFSFQPTDIAKLLLVLILAKYFSRRHIEIANIRHIIVSGIYAFILFILVALQPDFGGAIIIAFVWLGMTLVSGISKKHILALILLGAVAFGVLWGYGFKDYQKARVLNFLHPLADIRGSGYNAYQSTIAVGSGEILGKGIGYGTQSKLKFLPEYETDFVFAAFAEEWGFVGVLFMMSIFSVLMWRILSTARNGASNFEILYALGLAILFMSHFVINTGMNMGLLPVTGINLPFVSYGGSHLITSFFALGILASMRRYERPLHKDEAGKEFLGI